MVDGEVYYRTNSVMAKQKLPLPALERIRGMIDLRQQVNDLIQAQRTMRMMPPLRRCRHG